MRKTKKRKRTLIPLPSSLSGERKWRGHAKRRTGFCHPDLTFKLNKQKGGTFEQRLQFGEFHSLFPCMWTFFWRNYLNLFFRPRFSSLFPFTGNVTLCNDQPCYSGRKETSAQPKKKKKLSLTPSNLQGCCVHWRLAERKSNSSSSF